MDSENQDFKSYIVVLNDKYAEQQNDAIEIKMEEDRKPNIDALNSLNASNSVTFFDASNIKPDIDATDVICGNAHKTDVAFLEAFIKPGIDLLHNDSTSSSVLHIKPEDYESDTSYGGVFTNTGVFIKEEATSQEDTVEGIYTSK